MTELIAPPGLKGLAVADTAIGDVRGAEGFYHYRQYPAPMLARTHGFEAVTALLLDGELVHAAGHLEGEGALLVLHDPLEARQRLDLGALTREQAGRRQPEPQAPGQRPHHP